MKYLPTKKILAIIIVLGSVVASISIISSSKENPKEEFFKISANLNDANPYLNFKTSPNNDSNQKSQESSNNKILSGNLTDELINNYGLEILKRNPSGAFNQNGKQSLNMPSEKVFENLLENQIAQGLKINFYELKDLKLSNDNSLKAVRAYLEAINSAAEKNLMGIKKSPFAMFVDLFNKKNSNDLYQYLNRLTAYTTDLLKIPAPLSWQVFHLELLNLGQRKIATYQTLIGVEEDPIKALIAAQEIEKIDQAEFDLATVLREKLKDLNI
ncbi:MAG: hypothetical protein QMD50_02295 [Patescibacteria group bacterium]|nr:hypothetical protein [Patescibacteria group bacterium]